MHFRSNQSLSCNRSKFGRLSLTTNCNSIHSTIRRRDSRYSPEESSEQMGGVHILSKHYWSSSCFAGRQCNHSNKQNNNKIQNGRSIKVKCFKKTTKQFLVLSRGTRKMTKSRIASTALTAKLLPSRSQFMIPNPYAT